MQSGDLPLLTAHVFVSQEDKDHQQLRDMLERLKQGYITVKLYGPDDGLLVKSTTEPRVYLSIGTSWDAFPALHTLPLHERRRWLHFDSPIPVQPFHLFNCWLSYTDPLPQNKSRSETRFSSDTPLVSVFTATYRSKHKIQRPYESLIRQTYPNWEWVIVDDSGDNDETYHHYLLKLDDPRVRRYRQDSRNGYIGTTKRYAAGLCTGEILVEVDHDDELTPDCLEKIVQAFRQHPECGFAYGDSAEVYEGSHHSHWYGWDCGFGYCLHYRVFVHEMNRWQNVMHLTALNGQTIRHLVGLPNHPRAWTRDCYHLIGGHRPELMVSDDYDILVRTFLSTKFVAIPDLLYLQYRNDGGDNSTFQRNEQIQTLCRELERYYHQRIEDRVSELRLPSLDQLPYARIWETSAGHPKRTTAHINHIYTEKTSILFPLPYQHPINSHTELFQTLERGVKTGFRNMEVVVIGIVPIELETYAAKAPTGAIRWWPMEPADPLETCIEYGKLLASGSDIVVMRPESKVPDKTSNP